MKTPLHTHRDGYNEKDRQWQMLVRAWGHRNPHKLLVPGGHAKCCSCSEKQFGSFIQRCMYGTSLVVQWLRICLPMQATLVWSLVQEDSTCLGATKLMCHNYWVCPLKTCAPQEKLSQWEDHDGYKEYPPLAETRESPRAATKTQNNQK